MRTKGIDISKWQGSFDPQGNIDFIIQKVSEGLARDPLFDELLVPVKTIKRRGAYHYFRTAVDPIEQAEFFFMMQGNQDFRWLAIDYEKKNNVIDETSAYNFSLCFGHLVTLTDKPILVYTSPYLYRDNLCHYQPEINDYPLWMAYYGDGVNEPDYENDDPLFAPTDWLFWQWEADGNDKGEEYGVESDDIDLDVFNGTVAELDEWLGIPDTIPTNPTSCEELEKKIGKVYALAFENELDIARLDREVPANAAEIKSNADDCCEELQFLADAVANVGQSTIDNAAEIVLMGERIDELENKPIPPTDHYHPQWMSRWFSKK